MIVGIKDSLKLFGMVIVCFCATFVCTFFLNYYLDVLPMKGEVGEELMPLYNAQLATAQFTSIITGGILALIAAIMLIFYIKLYIDGHSKQLGILKAFGYPKFKIAIRFWVFGLSAFAGCALGYGAGHIAMPFIYKQLSINGLPDVKINFHVSLLILLVILPSAIFGLISCLYAYKALSRSAADMLKGTIGRTIKSKATNVKNRPFLLEFGLSALGAKKSLVFFVAFACFCFGSNVQMGLSMKNLTSQTMGMMILVIGVILAATTMFMAITSLMNNNKKNIAVMKAFGYSVKERSLAVLAGYAPFALLGFGLGTIYQFALLKIMINVVFKDVASMPEYSFGVTSFFITLACFIFTYALTMIIYSVIMSKISVKEIMNET